MTPIKKTTFSDKNSVQNKHADFFAPEAITA